MHLLLQLLFYSIHLHQGGTILAILKVTLDRLVTLDQLDILAAGVTLDQLDILAAGVTLDQQDILDQQVQLLVTGVQLVILGRGDIMDQLDILDQLDLLDRLDTMDQ